MKNERKIAKNLAKMKIKKSLTNKKWKKNLKIKNEKNWKLKM